MIFFAYFLHQIFYILSLYYHICNQSQNGFDIFENENKKKSDIEKYIKMSMGVTFFSNDKSLEIKEQWEES